MRSVTSLRLTEHDAIQVLNAVNGVGIQRIRRLMEYFGSAAQALCAPPDELFKILDLPQALAANLRAFSTEEFLKKEQEACASFGARVITFLDVDYPPALLTIAQPPAVLYVSGDFPPSLACSVAIVGSRRATLYGMRVAERLAAQLAELGVPVVSGLARGIDAAAHKGALRAGGATVAVLGCGLDVVYPSENIALYREIRDKGCLISEFSFGTTPQTLFFPRRNRIVSGLSLGVVVVEANIRSGALITAGFALEQGREVFAVPGPIDSALSDGPHALIRHGAKLVLSVADILEELPLAEVRPEGLVGNDLVDKRGLSVDERTVLQLIVDGCVTYESIEQRSGFDPVTLTPALLMLELKGKIVQKPGRRYALA